MGKILLIVFLVISITQKIEADEGMWALPSLNKTIFNKIKEEGFQLTDSDIYNLSQTSLKDAVVIFGNGCTGEIVSKKGLVFTNHHCGFDAIQNLSSLKDNYLKDGFWAKSPSEELVATGLTVTFLRSMEIVTNEILFNVSDTLTIDQRRTLIEKNISTLEKKSANGNKYKIEIKPFFDGNEYYKMEYEKFKDIRLVGTPPSSIGKFGFDTDNWMWPRHTGDFSIFRVYADSTGKPAEYSKNNIPLVTKKFLPISLKGIEKGDFAMTIGFPGSTERYIPSFGIRQEVDVENRLRILVRGIKQAVWMADMVADSTINLQYSSKYARSSNYWKNSIGMNLGVKKLNVIAKKEALEDTMLTWILADTQRKLKYGNVLTELKKGYADYDTLLKKRLLTSECLINGIEIYKLAYNVNKIVEKLESNQFSDISDLVVILKEKSKKAYKDYSPKTDKKVMAELLKTYMDQMKTLGSLPTNFKVLAKKGEFDYEKYANKIFSRSIFASEEKLMLFLNNPKSDFKKLATDPAYMQARSIYSFYNAATEKATPIGEKISYNNKLFVKALMEMNPQKTFYPDANFTMRLSYGTAGDYEPQDGVIYKHFTTLEGVIDKEIPNSYEFSVPSKLKELYASKDFGNYTASDNKIHVCFTTDNDITGGNSGSPVLNKNGELVGLAFDGNWEAMSGDVAYEPRLQKTISVDIRYVLFVIDKYGGATNIIDELKISK